MNNTPQTAARITESAAHGDMFAALGAARTADVETFARCYRTEEDAEGQNLLRLWGWMWDNFNEIKSIADAIMFPAEQRVGGWASAPRERKAPYKNDDVTALHEHLDAACDIVLRGLYPQAVRRAYFHRGDVWRRHIGSIDNDGTK